MTTSTEAMRHMQGDATGTHGPPRVVALVRSERLGWNPHSRASARSTGAHPEQHHRRIEPNGATSHAREPSTIRIC